MQPIRLGNFLLLELLSTSGLGQVWRGVHPEQGIAVAVKSAAHQVQWETRQLSTFRNEMRALAGIDHQGVVHIFDQGVVNEAAARASENRLIEGAPFTVIEYASGGTLAARTRWTWHGIKSTLLEMLDALAHCHSRGLYHRGLRPGNTLVCTEDDMRPGLKLSDVGLVDLYRRLGIELPAGVRDWLAPEQIHGKERDVGPATDLYALGTVAWWMATGVNPFGGQSGDLRVLPTLRPSIPVPDGFDIWVAKLLMPDVGDRYSRAADAAWALVNLSAPEQRGGPPTRVQAQRKRRGQVKPPPLPNVDHKQLDTDEDQSPNPDEEPTTTLYLPVGRVRSEVAPIPDTWRRADTPPLSLPIIGTGLRLFGMRHIPMVGREKERDRIWAGLLRVNRERRPRAIHVTGRAGVGKSRLVHWICERAHETGAAVVLEAQLGPETVPGEGVQRMVEGWARTGRLDRVQTEIRVTTLLRRLGVDNEEDAAALSELLSPDGRVLIDTEAESEGDSGITRLIRLEGARERHAIVLRLLSRIALERPVIVVIEDVQWGATALAFVKRLLRLDQRVLILLTSKEEELADRANEAARLRELRTHTRVAQIELGPLSAEATHGLAQRLLGREGTLARRVAEATAGNPLFAVEMVYDWVEEGMLEVGGTGLILREDVQLPGRLAEVWANRLTKTLREMPEQARRYLELAAALGLRVDDEEWQEVCDDPTGEHASELRIGTGEVVFSPVGARMRFELVDRLLGARLAVETNLGFAFSHTSVRDVVAGEARREQRWKRAHFACAQMIARRAERGQRGAEERLGVHLLEAGRPDAAIEPLMKGVEERVTVAGYRPAWHLLRRVEQEMHAMALPEDDIRWGELWLAHGRLAFLRNALDETEDYANRAVEAGRTQQWMDIERHARFQRAQVALRKGELEGAEADLKSIQSTMEDHYDPAMAGKALFGLAAVNRYRHEFDNAFILYGKACHQFNAAGHDEGAASCWRDMAAMEVTLGNPDRASTLYKRALGIYERIGRRYDMANCINGLAEVSRMKGDLGGAARGYRRALDLYESIGGGQIIVPRMNLGLVHLRREEYDSAREVFVSALKEISSQGQMRLEGHAHVALMVCAAASWDWSEFDHHLQGAAEHLHTTRFAEPDTGWCAQKAGDLARKAGQQKRASQAWAFALSQFEAIEDEDAAAEVRRRMKSA